ncbi:MAG: 50S ribosomal protein L5 [bacterium]
MNRLEEKFNKKIVPAFLKNKKTDNVMAVPKVDKIIVSIGAGKAADDKNVLETMINNLRDITGQQPSKKVAKKSISNFKLREGSVVGLMVTLRGTRMYDFLDRFINITLPRVRDFRGIDPKSFDKQGNITIGIKEHTVFPEIRMDQVSGIHGLEITIATTAKNDEETKNLLKEFNFPFSK